MKNLTILTVFLALSAWMAGCGGGGGGVGTAPLEAITKTGILEDVMSLSADDMEGRGAGTAGEERAAGYIEKRFKAIGLASVNGSYFQPVSMVGMKKDASRSSLTLRHGKKELVYRSDETLTYWSTAQKERVQIEDAPLVFVGYGVEAPEYNWDDFKGADVSGKVLLFLNDDPPVTEEGGELFGGPARTYYGRWTYKFEQAMRHGAAGALMIHTTPSASYSFSVVQHNGSEESFALDLPGSGYQVDLLGWIDEETSNQIASAFGKTVEDLFAMAAKRDFTPIDTGYQVSADITTQIRRVQTKNVLGMLEGSDSKLKDEVIVFSAHYDHLGTNENVEGPDKIFNGAWDNASGTASIISLAEAFAKTDPKPRRSLLFLACAAEEAGSLGSKWFVERPPFPLSRVVADFNVDMTQIFGVTSDISAIGVDTNSLGETLKQVAAGFNGGVQVIGDTNPGAGSFYRSDQVNFAKAGIPALFINPGAKYLRPLSFDPGQYEDEHYHQVNDEVNDKWDLSGAERDMRLLYQTALKVANADGSPHWNPGNEFELTWKKLHGVE